MSQNQAQHDMDLETYGEQLRTLYQKARLRRGDNTADKEREAAFNAILENYPDSYAAASLIAERALAASFQKDTETVEKYYDMLARQSDDRYRNVISGMGTEAVPAIEVYLAGVPTHVMVDRHAWTMVSTSLQSPMALPPRDPSSTCGEALMFSWPPATMISASPSRMA